MPALRKAEPPFGCLSMYCLRSCVTSFCVKEESGRTIMKWRGENRKWKVRSEMRAKMQGEENEGKTGGLMRSE